MKLREIQANQDQNATVQDLIAAYEQTSSILAQTHEGETYQWNNFVKDFRTDHLSKQYAQPMKVAAILSQKVRSSNKEKISSSTLFHINGHELLLYKNNSAK